MDDPAVGSAAFLQPKARLEAEAHEAAATLAEQAAVYRPVFMMHGINDNAKSEFTPIVQWLQELHPGTATYPLAMFENLVSLEALEHQLEGIALHIRKVVAANPAQFTNGYHLLCHSQGGLLCRTLVQYMDDHKVHTLISLAGPQLGVYGPRFFDFMKSMKALYGIVTGNFGDGVALIFQEALQNFTYENVYIFAYSWVGQTTFSVANMWNDPMHRPDFLHDSWLAKYNGLTSDEGDAARKANFVRLQKAVFLTGAPSDGDWDGGIEPASSGVFGFFADGSRSSQVTMKDQLVYTSDTFGLKTLDDVGKLVTQAVADVGHHSWVDDRALFEQYILPHLV